MGRAISTTPYWRLSGFYFFYFASLGALVPYWNLYLEELGFTAAQTGLFVGILMATKMVAPNIWGWIADHTGMRMRIVRIGCLLALLTYGGILLSHDYWWMLLVLFVFSFFWNAALPQFEATTFNHLGDHYYRYSNIRLWGSIGFILTVWGLGFVFERISVLTLPWFVLVLLAGIWMASLSVPESAAGHRHIGDESLWQVLRKPAVIGLLLVCFFMQASHGAYYAIYSRYMKSYDYSVSLIGTLWAVGVIAEVGIFLIMSRLVQRYRLRTMLIISLALATLRWTMIGLIPENRPLMVFAQCLHAASFGVYHATAIKLIHRFFTGRHQGQGQALYSSVSFGAGGALGSLASGYVWDYVGRSEVFLISAVLSLFGFFIAWRFVREHP
jgi:PPP family 3-phenylpropionic acid transporter